MVYMEYGRYLYAMYITKYPEPQRFGDGGNLVDDPLFTTDKFAFVNLNRFRRSQDIPDSAFS